MNNIPLKYPFNQFAYGADYNPEQWPEEVWLEDVKLMREAGVNAVSLAIFSWAKLEPRPGEYDFGWLDRIMDLLHTNGVSVLLATATASPPPWFAKLHPESLPVSETGVRMEIGSRQHYSPSSLAYKQAAASLAGKLAERYAKHPAVIMWHINNEYACHIRASYDEESATAFRVWLQRRYGSLEKLNDTWGTAFWSQQYADWEEIQPPRQAPTYPNPCQCLDFKRFNSDALLELCRAEIDAVKKHNPALPVTTNFMGISAPGLDQFAWARNLDVTSWDSYPDPAKDEVAYNASSHDLTRSTGGGKPFILLEQVTSQVNWRNVNMLKQPGVMRTYSWQAVARGADAVMAFQWRASRAGAEKFHGALVPHVGTADSRVWREVCDLGRELRACHEITGSRIVARVGMMFDWSNWWAVELPSKPREISHTTIVTQYHEALFDNNIPVDFVPMEGDLLRYQVLVLPLTYMLSETTAKNIKQFVANGGTLIVTWFSGIVDECDRIWLGGYPALLREVLGIRVEEWQPLPEGVHNEIKFIADGKTSICDFWSEAVDAEGAEVKAVFTKDFFAGRPALTCNRYGKGRAWYLATRLPGEVNRELFGMICREAGVQPLLEAPKGVEVSLRERDSSRYLFIINHTDANHEISLGGHHGADLLDGQQMVAGTVNLKPYDVKVLKLAV
ncbi:MAG: beta-galactosidase [Verrucomicrobiales bacterium]|jgi:beta-galactosidase|nr:beta-galactosidase [Verrucomicrobiales bacterium]